MLKNRFRSFLPIVVDVETGGLNEATDALLELAAINVNLNEERELSTDQLFHYHIAPFSGANLNKEALKVNHIDPFDPARNAIPETQALETLFAEIHKLIEQHNCSRAILVGHNAFFDLKFVNAAAVRCGIKNNPFHAFSNIDTVTLGMLAYGQTVLAKVAAAADIHWDQKLAHSAKYDTEITAKLFCKIFNLWESNCIQLPTNSFMQ